MAAGTTLDLTVDVLDRRGVILPTRAFPYRVFKRMPTHAVNEFVIALEWCREHVGSGRFLGEIVRDHKFQLAEEVGYVFHFFELKHAVYFKLRWL